MDKKKAISWTLYDWANSAFATTVMAGFFPIFFEKYWSNPELVNQSTFYLGLSNSVGSLIVAAMAPFLGAISDTGSTKKKVFIYICIFRYSVYLITMVCRTRRLAASCYPICYRCHWLCEWQCIL